MLPRFCPCPPQGQADSESAAQTIPRAIPARREMTASPRAQAHCAQPNATSPSCDGGCSRRPARTEWGEWQCGKTNSCLEFTIYDLRFTSENDAENCSTSFPGRDQRSRVVTVDLVWPGFGFGENFFVGSKRE